MNQKPQKETIQTIEPVCFTNLSEQMVRNAPVSQINIIVQYVSIINNLDPWRKDDFQKVKNEVIKLAKYN